MCNSIQTFYRDTFTGDRIPQILKPLVEEEMKLVKKSYEMGLYPKTSKGDLPMILTSPVPKLERFPTGKIEEFALSALKGILSSIFSKDTVYKKFSQYQDLLKELKFEVVDVSKNNAWVSDDLFA